MPMTDNRDYAKLHIVEKADMALADLAPGGLLLSEQADRFIQLAVDRAVAMPMMTKVPMKNPKRLVEKIRYTSDFLKKGSEATALPIAQRSVPTTSKVELDAQLLRGETRISYETLEDNIEREAFQRTVEETMSARIALDLEKLAFNGDTTSANALLKTLNGFIIQAVTNIHAGGSARLTRSMLKVALKTMPSEFRQSKRELRYFTADEAHIDYHETLADRATALGDDHVTADETAPFTGIPVVGVPVFPTNLGGLTDETVMLLCDPAQMLFGVHREVQLETDRDVSAGAWIVVVSLRVDFKFANELGVVRTNAVKALG